MLIGNLGADPEVRYMEGGQAVANFTMATSEKWKNKAGVAQEKTEWHKIVVWGKLAELCGEYACKGRSCYVEGKLQTRKWRDERSGTDKYTTEIVALAVQFLGPSPAANSNGTRGAAAANGDMGYGEPPADDDVPF